MNKERKAENERIATAATNELMIAAKHIKALSFVDDFARIKLVALANYVAAEVNKVPGELP